MKIGIVGIGTVGSSIAFALLQRKDIKEILVYDIDEKLLEGEVTDLNHASYILTTNKKINKVYKLSQLKDCKRVIITAGLPRKYGQTMDDIYEQNKKIIKEITKQIGTGHLLITNPVERLAEEFNHKPIGGLLDRIRSITDERDGDYIIKHKGHTNWGVTAEVLRSI